MKISKQARRDARQLFNACRTDGLLDDAKVRQAVQLVITRKPRGYVAMLSHFHRLVRLEVARRTARVENAVPSPDALKEAVRANLARRYGSGLDVSFLTTPELLGGLRVQVGSDVYDGSVRARLEWLRETFG